MRKKEERKGEKEMAISLIGEKVERREEEERKERKAKEGREIKVGGRN